MGAMIGQSTIQRLLGMFTTIVLARVLGSANFGIYSIVVNTANGAYGLVRMGIDAAIHAHIAEHHSDSKTREAKGQMLGTGLIILLGAGIIGAIICFSAALWIADIIYGRPELEHWIRLASVLAFIQCASQFAYTLLAGLHRFQEYSKVIVLSFSMSFVVISISSVFGGLPGALGGLITIQTITLWLLYRQARSAMLVELISLHFQKFIFNSALLLKNGFPFYAAGLVSVLSTYYIQGLVTQNFGLEAIGGLRVITSVTTLVSFVPTAIAAVMVSHLTRRSTSDYSDFVRITLLNVKYVWLFVLLSGSAIFILLPLIISILFGDTYISFSGPASIAILSASFACLIGVIGNIAFSRKRVGFIFFYTLIQFSVFLLISFIYVPQYGLIGYFIAELSGIICALSFIWLSTGDWRYSNNISAPWILKLFALSLIYVATFLLSAIYGADGIRSIIGLAIFIMLILVGYWGVLSTDDRNSIKILINNRLT
jgi:O-antigen/teichoic acid export membrane protein